MRYQILGKSRLRVSELYPATMTFGEESGFGVDQFDRLRVQAWDPL